MICVAFENTASISTLSIGSVGCSGRITRLTRKCFCLAMGLTAVHLVSSSFLGFSGFTGFGSFSGSPRVGLRKGQSSICFHSLSQFNDSQRVVAAPVVAGHYVKVISARHVAGCVVAVE